MNGVMTLTYANFHPNILKPHSVIGFCSDHSGCRELSKTMVLAAGKVTNPSHLLLDRNYRKTLTPYR